MKPSISPTIVVVAFNRPKALSRILKTISNGCYRNHKDVQLVISIDKSNCTDVTTIAEEFSWGHGTKKVIEHKENLGLRKHIIACGDLSQQYGSIILLEDDLMVSPEYYQYATAALNFYAHQPEISGISLYSYDFNEYAESRFIPLEDGFDSYFIQTASSWGQAWTYAQWKPFKDWYENNNVFEDNSFYLPQKIFEWPDRSWKKFFIKYMLLHKKYFIYPRVSLTTNFGDSGENHRGSSNYQVPLQLGKKEYVFSTLEQSLSVYDGHYELEPQCLRKLNHDLKDIDFECDLYGTKCLENIKSIHLISLKTCNKPISSYGLALSPQELNMAFESEGNCFSLGKTEEFTSVDSRRTVMQLKHLHKNLGWKRYGIILMKSIIDRIKRIF